MENFVKISDKEVEFLLTWSGTVQAVKQALISLSTKPIDGSNIQKDTRAAVQTPRAFTHLPSGQGMMISMPSYVQGLDLGYGISESSLCCKLLTVFEGNSKLSPPLPTTFGTVMMFNDVTGKPEAMIDADVLTQWRTAAVSCVAATMLGGPSLQSSAEKMSLAILGAGAQGRIHALAFIDQFQFGKIRIWNRTASRGQTLVNELLGLGANAELCPTIQKCVQNADVIITATTAGKEPILRDEWVKGDALVIAIGVGKSSELFPEIYERSVVYVESRVSAQKELPLLTVRGELGELISGAIPAPLTNQIRIFQSLGNGVEDAAVARFVYNLKTKKAFELY